MSAIAFRATVKWPASAANQKTLNLQMGAVYLPQNGVDAQSAFRRQVVVGGGSLKSLVSGSVSFSLRIRGCNGQVSISNDNLAKCPLDKSSRGSYFDSERLRGTYN